MGSGLEGRSPPCFLTALTLRCNYLPGDQNLLYLLSLIHAADLRMDSGVGLGLNINQPPIGGIKGDHAVLPPLVAEQHKGAVPARLPGPVTDISRKMAALINILYPLVLAGLVLQDKAFQLVKGGVFKFYYVGGRVSKLDKVTGFKGNIRIT